MKKKINILKEFYTFVIRLNLNQISLNSLSFEILMVQIKNINTLYVGNLE